MNKFSNFLLKSFSLTMVLSLGIASVAFAEETTQDKNWGIYSTSAFGSDVTICQQGQYVYSCGAYKVGSNWLNSVRLTGKNGTIKTTMNYNIGDDTYEKMEQMRAFFNKDRIVKYINSENPNLVLSADSSSDSIRLDREFILGIVCNPLDSTITIKCAACPDGGTVKPSKVKVGNDINNGETTSMLIHNSWEFHTIADCYVTNFEDASGSFIYKSPSVENSSNLQGEPCYYTNTSAAATNFIAGDDISSITFGTNAGNVQTIDPEIPQ